MSCHLKETDTATAPSVTEARQKRRLATTLSATVIQGALWTLKPQTRRHLKASERKNKMAKPPQTPKPDNKPELFVDNERYVWNQDEITGAQIRTLAALPDDVQIFHKVPGQPDVEIKDNTVVDLTQTKGPDRFYSQAVGSQAGGGDD